MSILFFYIFYRIWYSKIIVDYNTFLRKLTLKGPIGDQIDPGFCFYPLIR